MGNASYEKFYQQVSSSSNNVLIWNKISTCMYLGHENNMNTWNQIQYDFDLIKSA